MGASSLVGRVIASAIRAVQRGGARKSRSGEAVESLVASPSCPRRNGAAHEAHTGRSLDVSSFGYGCGSTRRRLRYADRSVVGKGAFAPGTAWSGGVAILSDGADRSRLAVVLGTVFFHDRDRIGSGQPTVEIDLAAAGRAERTMIRGGRPAADRAGVRDEAARVARGGARRAVLDRGGGLRSGAGHRLRPRERAGSPIRHGRGSRRRPAAPWSRAAAYRRRSDRIPGA